MHEQKSNKKKVFGPPNLPPFGGSIMDQFYPNIPAKKFPIAAKIE